MVKMMVKVRTDETEFFEGDKLIIEISGNMDVLNIYEDDKLLATFNHWEYWRIC